MKLPKAADKYDKNNEQSTRSQLETEDGRNLKTGVDADLGSASVGVIVRDSAGKRWRITIGTDGAITTVQL